MVDRGVVVLIVAVVLVALLGGLIALVVNPKTRVVGVVLLLVPLVLLSAYFVLKIETREPKEPPTAARAMFHFGVLDDADRARAEAMAHDDRARAEATARRDKVQSQAALVAEKPETKTTAEAAKPAKTAAKESPAKTSEPPNVGRIGNPSHNSETRPAWVEAPPRRVGDGYEIAVVTDPYATRLECEAKLPQALERAVAEYAAVYLGDEQAASQVRLPLDFIRTEVVAEEWEEPYESSVGPMVRVHALLRFDRAANARIDEARQRLAVDARLWGLGGALGGVLALLAVAWGYLRIDLATGGAYRWRLRIAAALAILAVLAALCAAD